jgi:hypothetical protein
MTPFCWPLKTWRALCELHRARGAYERAFLGATGAGAADDLPVGRAQAPGPLRAAVEARPPRLQRPNVAALADQIAQSLVELDAAPRLSTNAAGSSRHCSSPIADAVLHETCAEHGAIVEASGGEVHAPVESANPSAGAATATVESVDDHCDLLRHRLAPKTSPPERRTLAVVVVAVALPDEHSCAAGDSESSLDYSTFRHLVLTPPRCVLDSVYFAGNVSVLGATALTNPDWSSTFETALATSDATRSPSVISTIRRLARWPEVFFSVDSAADEGGRSRHVTQRRGSHNLSAARRNELLACERSSPPAAVPTTNARPRR